MKDPGEDRSVAAMRVDHATDLAQVSALVASWDLPRNVPVVVLSGGAAGMSVAAGDVAADAIGTCILPAVLETGAVLVTGGTDAGVMRLAGEARRSAGATFPLVGVLPGDLVTLPDDLAPGSDGGAPAAGDEAPRGRAAHVQPDHTHLLVVPGGRWGDETPWLYSVAEALAGARPVVTVVVNGGAVARTEVTESIRRGHAVLLVKGTGRAADDLAAGLVATSPGASGGADIGADGSGLVRAVGLDEDGALRAALADALRQQHGGSGMSQGAAGTASSGSGASYEDEMHALIERMDLSEEQRQFLRSRWLDQVMYMGDRASEAKRRYYRFRIATVVGGVIVPALVSISLAGPDRWGPWDTAIRGATFVVSTLVAITAAVEGFFHFGDRWRHYRVNAELLKSEGWQYLTHTGDYRTVADKDRAFQGFAARVEGILRDDVDGFMSKVTSTAPIEKHDIFTKL